MRRVMPRILRARPVERESAGIHESHSCNQATTSSSSAAAMPRRSCAPASRKPGRARACTWSARRPRIPYHRPPLSKTFLKSAGRDAAAASRRGLVRAKRASRCTWAMRRVAIDRAARTVTLRSGAVLGWERLVLATGTRARRLPALVRARERRAAARRRRGRAAARAAAGGAAGHRARRRLHRPRSGGHRAGARQAACSVLESAPRLLSRAVSPELSAHVLATHRAAGMDIRVGVQCGACETEGTRLAAIEVDGGAQPVDLLLLGIGAVPETALAQAAGLECADGIVVDAYMQTSDEAVLAVGDCTRFPDRRAGQRAAAGVGAERQRPGAHGGRHADRRAAPARCGAVVLVGPGQPAPADGGAGACRRHGRRDTVRRPGANAGIVLAAALRRRRSCVVSNPSMRRSTT